MRSQKATRPRARGAVALTLGAPGAVDAKAAARARNYDVLSVKAKHSWLARPLKLFGQELLALLSAAVTAITLLLIVNVLLVAFHVVATLSDLPY
jgi:hypothetical protein